TLDPDWRAVFVKYPDRFMVGTDTWVTSRWEVMRDYHHDVQAWLGQLPRDVAEAIAWKNGERLFPTPSRPERPALVTARRPPECGGRSRSAGARARRPCRSTAPRRPRGRARPLSRSVA